MKTKEQIECNNVFQMCISISQLSVVFDPTKNPAKEKIVMPPVFISNIANVLPRISLTLAGYSSPVFIKQVFLFITFDKHNYVLLIYLQPIIP